MGEKASTDPNFAQFTDIVYGYRAAFLLLRKYIYHYHADTIEKIIHKWAPDGEKAERAYMQSVSKWCSIPVNQPLDFDDKLSMTRLVQAMARFENGCDIEMAPINYAYEKYFGL